MITKIGLVAGDIWNHLDNNGGFDQIENIIDKVENERDVVFMSLGWLAREGHIFLKRNDSGYIVELSKSH